MEKGFTLIIPLYNKVNACRNTFDSVLKNHGTYPFKCIIVDDDSTDGSSEVAMEYDEKYPDIFMYIKKKHRGYKGPVYARNLGIDLCKSQYIGFLDADDELCEGFIDRACNFLDEHPEINMYACGQITCRYDSNGNKEYIYYNALDDASDFTSYILNGVVNIHHSTHIYKTELVKQHPFTDCFNEDVVFKLKYVYYNKPIYFDNSTCNSIIWNTINGESTTWDKQKNMNNTNKHGLEIVFDILKDEIPNFDYSIEVFDDNKFKLCWL